MVGSSVFPQFSGLFSQVEWYVTITDRNRNQQHRRKRYTWRQGQVAQNRSAWESIKDPCYYDNTGSKRFWCWVARALSSISYTTTPGINPAGEDVCTTDLGIPDKGYRCP